MPQEDNPQQRSPDFVSHTPRWDAAIPEEIQIAIGDAVRSQVINLPVNLFVEWFTPKFLDQRWFVEAAEHIHIPHPEYWRDIDDA